jgi:Xaa-Pro dipeptidase
VFRRGFLQTLVAGIACACGPRPSGVIAVPSAAPANRLPLPPIDSRIFLARVDKVRALAREAGADWAFVSSGTTSFAYLTGASIERSERLIALLVPVAGDPVVVAPSFEVERVRRTVRLNGTVRGWEESQSPFEVVRGAIPTHGGILVEPHGEYGTAIALAHAIPDARLVDGSAAFESLRVVKQSEELARIRRAVAITHDVFDRAFAELRSGVRDRDVSQGIAGSFEREGYEGYALVQFGPLSALPHGHPAGAVLASDVAVLIDGGCRVEGYWSDVTRTRWFGPSPPSEFRRIADVVADSQRAGIARAQPGVEAQEVDRAARQLITKAGYGPYFTHRTGHGLGMDGHEPIYMVEGNRTPLVPGCVFTVEPGIYLPGRFGVRIEDDVVCEGAASRVIEGA